jgi:RNA polymerase sigma factor (sigma-70 family)
MQPRLLKHPARLAGASLLRLQDDDRLVALAREGHDPAFAAIVDRYGPQLERYCARLLGPGRAEDAVQQAFVNAHAAMKASDQELALKPWLYRIAHNASLNILRASKGEDEALDEDRAGATLTTDVVELRERLRETLASIQALPAAQRDALLLRELEGRSHEEIAVALGVTAGGARQHLHRARMSLRAAASAITPYPLLSRILTAAAADGRSADLVSGAGMGLGAGAVKAAAGVLAAGAIAGGAVTAHHHAPADAPVAAHHAVARQSADAPGDASAAVVVADRTSSRHEPRHGSRSRATTKTSGRHRAPVSEVHRSGSSHDDGAEHEPEHHGSSGSSGSGSSGTSTKPTGDDHSGPGGGGASDDAVTTTSTTDNSGPGSTSSGSGLDDGVSGGSSGPGSGETTTTTATDGHSGSGWSGSGNSGSDDHTTTTTTSDD